MQVTDGWYRIRNGEAVSVYVDRMGWVRSGTGVYGRVWYPSGLFSSRGPTEHDLIARLPDYPIRLTFKARGYKGKFGITLNGPPNVDGMVGILEFVASGLNCEVSELEVMYDG